MRKFVGLSALALVLVPSLACAQDMTKPSTAPVATPTAPSPSMTVAEKVKEDWPKYDIGLKGHLTKAELSAWLRNLRTANGEAAPDANWLAAAFTQTDTDGNKKVSPEELTASLSTGR